MLGSRMRSGSSLKYRLGHGSSLLRPATWRAMERNALKALIQRFSTRESLCYRKGKPGALWRRRRLAAIVVFESRFGPAPTFFTQFTLPRFSSFYVHKGQYLWPSTAQPVTAANGLAAR
jgi:hypothetical protein